jgi:hypothetical protein
VEGGEGMVTESVRPEGPNDGGVKITFAYRDAVQRVRRWQKERYTLCGFRCALRRDCRTVSTIAPWYRERLCPPALVVASRVKSSSGLRSGLHPGREERRICSE